MSTIYQDYSEEPADVFLQLPEALNCQFYALEMDTCIDDLIFYEKLLPQRGHILELGCGTGRISCRLASGDRPVTGVDISLAMLSAAQQKHTPFCEFLCMDMVDMAFRKKFSTIIIPYNTLNLLTSTARLNRCLSSCREYLEDDGTLLAEIFVPSAELVAGRKRTFQFQMFNRPQGGRLIKEVLRRYCPASETIDIEERYRVRPMQKGVDNEDWHTCYTIAAFSKKLWFDLFTRAGLNLCATFGDYHFSPFHPHSSSLLILLKK